MSILEEKVNVLANCLTTLNESFKNDRLMRLMRIKKQCEDVSMPLDCMGLENGSHKEEVECVLEEEHMEVSLTSLEPKSVCVETQDKGLVRDEPKLEVGVKQIKSLKVSLLSETRRGDAAVGMLSCNCEDCVKESQDQGLSEMLGFQVSQDVTVDGDEGSWGSSHIKKVQEKVSYFIPSSNVQNLNFSCKTESWFMMAAMKGISIVVFTPHFHYYMLLKLMISLDHLGVVICCFELRIGVLCLSLGNLFIMVKWTYLMDVNCLGLDYLRFNVLRTMWVSPKLLAVVHSNFRMCDGVEMKQVTLTCFHCDILILGSNVDIMVFIGKGKCIPSLWNDEFDANDVGITASCVVIRPRHFVVIFDPGGNKTLTIL